MTEEQKKHISMGMRKKFANETDEEKQIRQQRRKEKAKLKNVLLEAYLRTHTHPKLS